MKILLNEDRFDQFFVAFANMEKFLLENKIIEKAAVKVDAETSTNGSGSNSKADSNGINS
jgi:hypothetical protein